MARGSGVSLNARGGKCVLIASTVFVGVSALVGGLGLISTPDGSSWFPLSILEGTPFRRFIIPGVLLSWVGLVNSVAALGVWRRWRFGLDLSLFAGGILTGWIAVEVALLGMTHWLQALYGVVGLVVLGVSMVLGWRSGEPRHRWVVAVTLAEAIGFAVPATVGALAAVFGWTDAVRDPMLVVAGLVEGAAMGWGQASVFPRPIDRKRYVLLSSIGTGIVWAIAMGIVRISSVASGPWVGLVAMVGGMVGLFTIGVAQWFELRRVSPRARRWISWTALAWGLALPMSFLPSPLVDESTPVEVHVVLWSGAGVLMAWVMARVTWRGVRSLGSPEAP